LIAAMENPIKVNIKVDKDCRERSSARLKTAFSPAFAEMDSFRGATTLSPAADRRLPET
jgi:hypothetical protein